MVKKKSTIKVVYLNAVHLDNYVWLHFVDAKTIISERLIPFGCGKNISLSHYVNYGKNNYISVLWWQTQLSRLPKFD